MRVIDPYFEFLEKLDGKAMMQRIEKIGRICYKSEDKISESSHEKFIANLLRRGHESVIEHEKISVKIVCDRGVTHEIVRHRIASYSQESTRYCNYSKDKFGHELTFIRPSFWHDQSDAYKIWEQTMAEIEKNYFLLLDLGATPQEARSILPNSLKTEIAVTMNLREWRHFFRLRCSSGAHPQMREIALPMLKAFQQELPLLFGDVEPED